MGKQTVLVTGASSGIGKETTKTLVREGYTVYAAARRLEAMKELAALGANIVKMDITQEADRVAAVEEIKQNHGGVDILINNAGFALYGAMEDTALEDARYQFEVNLFGPARLTQLVLPHMREKRAGKIVNISSMGGKIYTPLGSWYHASKHALEGWSDCLRIELKQFNIDVIIIEPGTIGTEFGDVMVEPMLKRSGQGPYGRMANAMAKTTRDSYDRPNAASPASVVAETIVKAIRAKRPATRYVVGKMARPLILLRRWFGDRVFDAVVMSSVR